MSDKRSLWTIKETADYLGMSTSWVYKRVSARDIPHCKLGTAVRFVPAQIERFAEQMAATSNNVVPLRGTATSDCDEEATAP